MNRLFSNGPSKDFVINPFNHLIAKSSHLFLAAPYFTMAAPIVDAAKSGKVVQLLVGLNSATTPQALAAVHGVPNLTVRYLTRRFHAKIFLFDDFALVGSSNLTDGGLQANREAVVMFDSSNDSEVIEEVRVLFFELWGAAEVLTPEKLNSFKQAWLSVKRQGPDPDTEIENAVGKAEPSNINVASHSVARERIFLRHLERQVHEQYGPAFYEVTNILKTNGFRRRELEGVGISNETNRFLNWVRLTYVLGDEAWQLAPIRSESERHEEITRLGKIWTSTDNSKIDKNYIEWLKIVQHLFSAEEKIASASKDEITRGLMSIHAFIEQLRFVKGGATNLPIAFWSENREDVEKVRRTLTYLLFGSGDFIKRLHDVLYDQNFKLKHFGRFCALELYGTIKPDECPPLNGRMAKALRYLGFDVPGI
jgi:hypothetical protein